VLRAMLPALAARPRERVRQTRSEGSRSY
jgi:hypothetical protein